MPETISKGLGTREQLQELHGILVESLLTYMKDTPPQKRRAAVLDIIRAFLKDNGITKNLNSAKDVATSLEELSSLSIPFLPDHLN